MKQLFFSQLLLVAALLGVPLQAAEPTGTGSMSTGEAGALLGVDASQFEADVMFDRYCDPDEFIAAVRKVDAEGVVDFVLQLAHGKSILGRERHGLTVDEAAAVALAVATEVGDTKALERLTAAAERHGLKDVAGKLAAAGKLGGASRGEAPAVVVSVLETDPAQFGDLKDVENHLRVIKLTGDGAHAKALQEYVAELPSLSDEQKKDLTQRCSRAADAAGGKPVAHALKKLATPVRGCGMDGAWQTQYQAADGSTVDAYVEINGNSGTYSVPGCQGQLYNLRASAPFGGGPMVVQGQWRFCGGETGTFRWSVNGDSFRGYWTFSGGGSPMCRWDGSRDYGGGGGGGWQPDPGNGGGGGGFPNSGGGGGGGEIDDLLDGEFTSDSGASISVNNQNVQMTTASGMRLLGRLNRYGNGRAQATFQVGGRPRTSTIRVINRNQIQVGNTTFYRR